MSISIPKEVTYNNINQLQSILTIPINLNKENFDIKNKNHVKFIKYYVTEVVDHTKITNNLYPLLGKQLLLNMKKKNEALYLMFPFMLVGYGIAIKKLYRKFGKIEIFCFLVLINYYTFYNINWIRS